MLGLVPSASLLGVDGHAVTVEVHVSSGLPSFTVVGSPDCRLPGGQRPGAGRPAVERLHVADAAGHGEPGAAHRAQGRVAGSTSPSPWRCSWPPEQLEPSGRRGPGLPRRARPRRLAAAGPGHAVPHRGAGRRAPSCCPRPAPPRPASSGGRTIHGLPSLAAVAGLPARRGAVARAPEPRRRPPSRPGPRPRRRPRPAGRPLRARGRRRRRPPPADDGPAGRGQDDARLAPAGPAAAAHRSGRPRDHPDPLGRRPRAARRRAWCGSRRSGRRTTAPPRWRWSVAAARRCGPARSAPPATACCSSTSWPSSPATCSTPCANRWRRGWCGSPGPPPPSRFPARFLLVAAMNPCPCGYGGRPGGCRCSDAARARYHRRLSGPLLDRFDLRVEVTRPSVSDLMGQARCEPTAAVRSRVLAARAVASARGVDTQRGHPGRSPRRARAAGARGRGGPGAGPAQRSALGPGAPPGSPGGPHGGRPAGRRRGAHRRPCGDGPQPARRCRAGHPRPGAVRHDRRPRPRLRGPPRRPPRSRARAACASCWPRASAEAGWVAMGGDPRRRPVGGRRRAPRGGDRAAHRGRAALPRPTDPVPGSARALVRAG